MFCGLLCSCDGLASVLQSQFAPNSYGIDSEESPQVCVLVITRSLGHLAGDLRSCFSPVAYWADSAEDIVPVEHHKAFKFDRSSQIMFSLDAC